MADEIDRFCLCDMGEHVDLMKRLAAALKRKPHETTHCPYALAASLFWLMCETLETQDRFSVSAVLLELLRRRHERTGEHERLGPLGFLVTDPRADMRLALELKEGRMLT